MKSDVCGSLVFSNPVTNILCSIAQNGGGKKLANLDNLATAIH